LGNIRTAHGSKESFGILMYSGGVMASLVGQKVHVDSISVTGFSGNEF